MKKTIKKVLILGSVVIGIGFWASPSFADCTAPAGTEGQQVYNSTYKIMQYCDGTNWIGMGSGGASSGGVTFAGLVEVPNGDLGGIIAANGVCDTAFSGSRVAHIQELASSKVIEGILGASGLVNGEKLAHIGGRVSSTDFVSFFQTACSSFRSSSGTNTSNASVNVYVSDGVVTLQDQNYLSCANPFKLICIKD